MCGRNTQICWYRSIVRITSCRLRCGNLTPLRLSMMVGAFILLVGCITVFVFGVERMRSKDDQPAVGMFVIGEMSSIVMVGAVLPGCCALCLRPAPIGQTLAEQFEAFHLRSAQTLLQLQTERDDEL